MNWDDVKTADDVVADEEKRLLEEGVIVAKSTCPFLSKFGEFFYACGKLIPEGEEFEPEPFNLVYRAKQGPLALQLYCWDRCEACDHYSKPGEAIMP